MNLLVEQILIERLSAASGESWSIIVQDLARRIHAVLPPE